MARDRASRPGAKPLRLFVAIEIPSSVRGLVAAAVAPFRERFPRARWVPAENQHVTVKFLGSTWPRLLGRVMEVVETVASECPPFESRVSGLGAFPSERRARVLWAGLWDPADSMTGIAAGLDEGLARDFTPEKRGFTPHLTVARFEPPVRIGGLESDLRSEPFRVDQVVLFRSHLRRPAPIYEPLKRFPLGGR
jgi:RNA 2',3'-cyclic 3'-phosphodiesterase